MATYRNDRGNRNGNHNYDRNDRDRGPYSNQYESRGFTDDGDRYQHSYSKGYRNRNRPDDESDNRYNHYADDHRMQNDYNDYQDRHGNHNRADTYENRGRGNSGRFSSMSNYNWQASARQGDYNNNRRFSSYNSGNQRSYNTQGNKGYRNQGRDQRNSYSDNADYNNNRNYTSQDGIYDNDMSEGRYIHYEDEHERSGSSNNAGQYENRSRGSSIHINLNSLGHNASNRYHTSYVKDSYRLNRTGFGGRRTP